MTNNSKKQTKHLQAEELGLRIVKETAGDLIMSYSVSKLYDKILNCTKSLVIIFLSLTQSESSSNSNECFAPPKYPFVYIIVNNLVF